MAAEFPSVKAFTVPVGVRSRYPCCMDKTLTQFQASASPIDFGDSDTLPSEIDLMPVGDFRLRTKTGRPNGPTARVSNPQAVIAESMRLAASGMIPIDFDHGLDDGGTKDGRAAGWITGLKVIGEKIVASVQWTASGRAALEGKDYRFISPTFFVNAAKNVTHIVSAGLTNYPALTQLKILASSKENDTMPQWLKDLAAKLGMPDETDEEKITAAANAAVDQNALVAPIIAAAGLTGPLTEAGATAIVTKMTASATGGDPDPSKFVPKAALDEVNTRLAKLQNDVTGNEVSRVVASAMAEGKIPPAQKDWAEKLGQSDLDSLKAYIASAPKLVVTDGGQLVGEPPEAKIDELTEDEKMICAATNVSEADFLLTKQGKTPAAKKAEG